MRLSIIGAGKVGTALGDRFTAAGHEVHYGVRDVAKAKAADETGTRSFHPLLEAAQGAEFIFLCVPGAQVVQALAGLGPLEAEVVVDCTNPVRWESGPVWAPPTEGSNAAAIAAALPNCTVLKAFNAFGAEHHANPNIGSAPANVFVAGDEIQSKGHLLELIKEAGFAGVDAGPLRNAAVLENLAVLWIHLATVGGHGRDFVLNMLRG